MNSIVQLGISTKAPKISIDSDSKDDLYSQKYTLHANPYPIRNRQVQQIWRRLKSPIRLGQANRIDINATICKIAEEGIFTEEIKLPFRLNQIEILFLIDFGESMIAFHDLADIIVSSAKEGGRFNKTSVYYFQSYLDEYVYGSRYYESDKKIQFLLEEISRLGYKVTVVIISDAGAAYGRLDDERTLKINLFLKSLKKRTNKIAWLNPLSQERWTGTPAEILSGEVSMFEITAKGLSNSISILR